MKHLTPLVVLTSQRTLEFVPAHFISRTKLTTEAVTPLHYWNYFQCPLAVLKLQCLSNSLRYPQSPQIGYDRFACLPLESSSTDTALLLWKSKFGNWRRANRAAGARARRAGSAPGALRHRGARRTVERRRPHELPSDQPPDPCRTRPQKQPGKPRRLPRSLRAR